MIKLVSYIHSLKKNQTTRFIFYEICLIFGFALAYWISDHIYLANSELLKKLGLGHIKKVDNLYSYLWFSLITQTTVGFGGTLPDGDNLVNTQSVILRFLMILQLFSIILVTGWTLS